MRRKATSLAKSLRARLGVLLGPVAKTPAAQASQAPVIMNPSISESLPPDAAELSRRFSDRNVALFLLDRRMIERQNALIARAVHAFFQSTQAYREVSVQTIAKHVDEFRNVFLESPITMNVYGANFPSGVNLFLMARCLGPDLIVESGVYKGQSSYFLASACPRAKVHAFDPNLQELSYRTPGVIYHENDWMNVAMNCDPGRGLCFFDDHQSQALRVIQAHERGFRHMIVDDSWPIEAVIGCGWPPLPSIDMIMSNPLDRDEVVKWIESGKMWTYVHTEEMRELCSRARRLIKAAYEVPSLYRECGIAPTSAYKFVELA